jgi:hypothetical protein
MAVAIDNHFSPLSLCFYSAASALMQRRRQSFQPCAFNASNVLVKQTGHERGAQGDGVDSRSDAVRLPRTHCISRATAMPASLAQWRRDVSDTGSIRNLKMALSIVVGMTNSAILKAPAQRFIDMIVHRSQRRRASDIRLIS